MNTYQAFEVSVMRLLSKKETILDVGGGSRFMKGMKRYEPWFADVDYKTLDVSPDYGPDIVGDIHRIPLADASVDGVICRSVLEHVEDPRTAIREMNRILKPGGSLFLQVPSLYPYHARTGRGAYPDYWRFFEDSLRLMLADFSSVEIVKHGGWFRILSYLMPGQAKIRWILDPLVDALDRVFRTDRRTNTALYAVHAIK